MHRSGTSFLARALNLMGVHLGDSSELISDQWRPLEDNPKGHWENKEILELAEKTLSLNNGSWHKIPEKITVSEELGKKIEIFIQHLSSNPSLAFGFKDPRIILCLNAWMPYIPKQFTIVGIFRNPTSVIESLKKRNNLSYNDSLYLWREYNRNLLEHLDRYNGYLLNFDWDKKRLFSEIQKIGKDLDLVTIDLTNWYDDSIIHNKYDVDIANFDDETKKIYETLTKRAESNKPLSLKTSHSKDDLKKILDQYIIAIKNQGDYFQHLNSDNVQKIKSLEAYTDQLDSELKSKEAELANTKKYTDQLDSELKSKEAELAKARSYAEKLVSEIRLKENEIESLKSKISILESKSSSKYYDSRL